ncbi:MAG: hypothetical protein Q9162_006415 [Coniocarpon cinnabarinum]
MTHSAALAPVLSPKTVPDVTCIDAAVKNASHTLARLARPALPVSTLNALAEFYEERDAKSKEFENLKSQAEDDFAIQQWSMSAFTEDWNASQFWYTDETATVLAQALLDGAHAATRIAVVSAPSVFISLKNLISKLEAHEHPQLTLFEFDRRFNIFREFVYYDFAQPLKLDAGLKGVFDRIICDPPFLSEDCQTKTAMTVQWLVKPALSSGTELVRLISCTGERMADLILRLYSKFGMQNTNFTPKHAKGLSNEFRCYANFTCTSWELSS